MADYHTNVDLEPSQETRTLERRITTNSPFIAGGIVPAPIPATPTVRHRAVFNSAGHDFTVAELTQALGKLGTAARAATISFEKVVVDHGSANTQAVVEWDA